MRLCYERACTALLEARHEVATASCLQMRQAHTNWHYHSEDLREWFEGLRCVLAGAVEDMPGLLVPEDALASSSYAEEAVPSVDRSTDASVEIEGCATLVACAMSSC